MKSTFSELREAALKLRGERYEFARREYQRTIAEIIALERRLTGKDNPKSRKPSGSPIDAMILSLMPKDRSFITDEMRELILESDPSKKFIKSTIATALNRLANQGKIKKLSTSKGNMRATYASLGFKAEPSKTIFEWVNMALQNAGRPLSTIELLVAMKELGYQMQTTQKRAVTYVNRMLRGDTDFVRIGSAWKKKD